MTDDELEELLDRLEAGLEREVRKALSQVAYDFTRSVKSSTSLTAAAFSVSSIRGMWARHVPQILRRVLGIAGRGAEEAARNSGERLPGDWENLPGRSDRGELPEEIRDYVSETRALLDGVGDALSREAVAVLNQGVAAGETQSQLEARLIAAFNRSSPSLGEARAARIARTESTRAWNAATLGVAQALQTETRRAVKQWITRQDSKVRPTHREVNGQLRLIEEPFDVGGTEMMYPGDPAAPADESVNCRCVLRTSVAERNQDVTASNDGSGFQSHMPAQLKRYWLAGPGAARIGWGTPGAFKRCVRELNDEFPEDTEGLCANLYHEATGRWPGRNHDADTEEFEDRVEDEPVYPDPPKTMPWSTPGDAALAFENQQSGDARVLAAGSLYWGDGPWPLQYADEMNGGHDGAELAGCIRHMERDGEAIRASGELYLTLRAGSEAAMLLAEGAPLGVSVDLDDVDLEVVSMDNGHGEPGSEDSAPYTARLVTASLLPLPDGGYVLAGRTAATWTASGESLVGESSDVVFHVGADGRIPGEAFTAAAGDPGDMGTVIDQTRSGDQFMRITRARVRGATLVAIPAFANARIVLDDTAFPPDEEYVAAAADGFDRVVDYVRKSPVPVASSEAAHALKMSIASVRGHMADAAQKGFLVRIARGMYIRRDQEAPVERERVRLASAESMEDLTAAATGAVDLPVAGQDAAWDGPGALRRLLEAGKADQGCAYRVDGADPATQAAWKLPYADIVDGAVTIFPKGVSAALGALNGARGGTDIPADQVSAVRNKLEAVSAHVAEVNGTEERSSMEASAWTAMQDLPPMPAAWFAEPTLEELPPGGAGVNYSNGRIFGWVAQAGEPHAGFAKKVTIDGLGRIETTHFLRQRFTLDDGSTVKAGAFTMNAGHHRDGAECETSACQFDDTRTVAGIVTVGMNERGMWFSGAAAPWMSEWDRSVFMATQPSYHLRKGGNGNWQLRAVLSVPVPGHSSPLMASAVVERAQLALTAAATMAEVEEAVAAAKVAEAATEAVAPEPVAAIDYDKLADALVAAMARAEDLKAREEAELAALVAEAGRMADEALAASGFPYDDTDTETTDERA